MAAQPPPFFFCFTFILLFEKYKMIRCQVSREFWKSEFWRNESKIQDKMVTEQEGFKKQQGKYGIEKYKVVFPDIFATPLPSPQKKKKHKSDHNKIKLIQIQSSVFYFPVKTIWKSRV